MLTKQITQMHSVDRTWEFLMVNLAVHKVTNTVNLQ